MSKFPWKTVIAAVAVAAVLGASVFAYAQLSSGDGPMGMRGHGMMGGMGQMHQQMMQGGGMHGGAMQGGGMHGGMGEHGGMGGGMHGPMGTQGRIDGRWQGSPYAGQQSREIKSLSDQDIDDLKNARGMGLAKAAELNSYPGPLHALEFADQLGLSAEQIAKLKAIKERMGAGATPIGLDLISRERDLDRLFARREIDRAKLDASTGEIGVLQGRLRAVHLAAHLETTDVLDDAQRKKYDALRGYASADNAAAR